MFWVVNQYIVEHISAIIDRVSLLSGPEYIVVLYINEPSQWPTQKYANN